MYVPKMFSLLNRLSTKSETVEENVVVPLLYFEAMTHGNVLRAVLYPSAASGLRSGVYSVIRSSLNLSTPKLKHSP